jgi:hypothetical protein
MKAYILKIEITYNGEQYQNQFPYLGDYQPILSFAEDDWYEEIGSKIPNFNSDLYECYYEVVPIEEEVVSSSSNS